MKIKSKLYIILFGIFVLALFTRLFALGNIPFGLHEDEIMNGYVGRFILQNGKDLYNHRWPLLYFDNFGDYPNVIPMYLSGAFTYVFGNTAFAIRFPIAVFGALTVFPVFGIGSEVFKRKRYALISALFIAIMPWHIVLSRSTAENITATCVFATGLWLLLQYRKSLKLQHLLSATGTLASTYLLYPSYRVIVPLTLFFFTILCWEKRITRKYTIVLTILFFILTLGIGKTVWGQGRFKQTSIFSFNNAVNGRLENFGFDEGKNQVFRARIFHNKIIGYSRELVHQYISYFSPTFLFTDGGKPYRYKVDDAGLLYLGFLVIMVLGVGVDIFGDKLHKDSQSTFSKQGKTLFLFLLVVLGLTVLPSALTLDDVPNVHRTVAMSVFFVFPITYALTKITKLGNLGKLAILCITILTSGEFIYFWHQFGVHAPSAQTVARGDDRTTLAHFVLTHKDEYDKVFLPRDAKALYFLFYSNNYDASLAGKFTSNIMVSGFDNLVFIDNNCVTSVANLPITPKSLVIDRGECIPVTGSIPLKTILRADGTPSFRTQIFPGPKASKK